MFCSRCGHEIGDADRYCPNCSLALSPATIASTPPLGMSASGAAGHVGSVDGDDPDADLVEGPAGPGGRRGSGVAVSRRRLLLGVGLVVLTLIGVGAWTAVRDPAPGVVFLGGYGEMPLNKAVTSQPHQQWKRDLPDSNGTSVVIDHGVTFISTGNDRGTTSTIVAVEDDGDERWSIEQDQQTYGIATSPDHDLLLVISYAGETDVQDMRAISVDDGSVAWENDAGQPLKYTDDGLLLYADNRVLLVDTDSGDTVWDVPNGDDIAASTDLLFVIDDDNLTAYDLGSGERQWQVDDLPCDGGDLRRCPMAATDELAVVAGGSEAVAYDSQDGSQLWRQDISEAASPGVMGAGLVYLASAGDLGDRTDRTLVTFDRAGQRSESSTDADRDGFAPFGVVTEGRSYLFDWAGRDVYDDRLELLAHYDGDVTLTSGGLYALERSELSYRRFDRDDPVWVLDVPPDATSVTTGDKAIAIVWDDEIALYR